MTEPDWREVERRITARWDALDARLTARAEYARLEADRQKRANWWNRWFVWRRT